MHAAIRVTPCTEKITTASFAADNVSRVRRLHRDNAADRRAPVERRRGSVQDLYILHESCIDEITCRVRETAGIELVRQRYTVNYNGDSIAADTANIDPFRAKACSGRFIIYAGNITENVVNRSCELVIEISSRYDRDRRSNLADGARVFVCNNDNLIDCLPII